MKKKNLKKLLLAVCCAALLVCVSIGATVAYLTSNDAVKNTFTVGNVQIKLDEAKTDDKGNGTPVEGAARVKANKYHLLPGHSYTKDPTVTVLAGSEESYVRMLVTVTFGKQVDPAKLPAKLDGDFVTGYNDAWKRNGAPDIKDVNGKTVVKYEYRYDGTVAARETDTVLPALFTGIQIPGTWTTDDLAAIGGFDIDIVAQAIQADGVNGRAEAAWTAFGA